MTQAEAVTVYRELVLLTRLIDEIAAVPADDWVRQLLPAFEDRRALLRYVLGQQDPVLLASLAELAEALPQPVPAAPGGGVNSPARPTIH